MYVENTSYLVSSSPKQMNNGHLQNWEKIDSVLKKTDSVFKNLELPKSSCEDLSFIGRYSLLEFPPIKAGFSQKLLNISALSSVLGEKLFYPTCYTSKAMTKLLTWRNTPRKFKVLNILSKVATEISLPFLTVSATIETIVYAIFKGINFIFSAFDKVPFPKANALWYSSTFTVRWTIMSLYSNLFPNKLPESEDYARSALDID